MRVLGITNKIDELRLFFWEYDHITDYQAYESANFLSQAFGIDIYVLQSSKDSYHLISFDLLPLETVEQMQNWAYLDGVKQDYLTIKEQAIDHKGAWNTLRISCKGNKQPPKYLKSFRAKANPNLKAYEHMNIYHQLCGVPIIDSNQFVNAPVRLASYNTGIGLRHHIKKAQLALNI